MMKKTNAVLSILSGAALLFVVGCRTQDPTPGGETTERGTLIFSAIGESVADAADKGSIAKARVAAATIAKANLLEKVKGALISNQVSVGDLMFKSQSASSSVNGWLARANVEYEEVDVNRSRLPDSEPGDIIITATATLEIPAADMEALKAYVE